MSATRTGTSTVVVAGSYFHIGRSGAAITAANAITITDGFHQVNGTLPINTINGGEAGMGVFLYKPVGATWTFGSGGNIKASVTPLADRVTLLVTPDGTTWYAGADVPLTSVTSANTDISVVQTGDNFNLTFNPGNVALTEFTGTIPIAQGGTGQTSKTPAFDALSPAIAKGDLITHNGSDAVRRAVGTNDYVLTADSAETDGVKWDNTLNLVSGVFSGQVQVGDGSAVAPGLAVGSTDKGLYEIGASELGLSVAGAGELSLNASRLAPVTTLGQSLGDSDQVFLEGWVKRDFGWATKTLSTTLGGAAQSFLTVTNASPDTICAFQITTVVACKSGTLYSAYDSAGEIETWNTIICRDQSTTPVVTLSASVGSASSAGTGGGTASGTITAAAGVDIVTYSVTTAGTVATPVEVTLYYKITVICGNPTFAEV